MKFDAPATTSPIDRIEGPLKTSGTATYAYEHHADIPPAAYGYIVGAAVARGRIERIDDTEAKQAPGVLAIVSHENSGPVGLPMFLKIKTLAGPQIDHYHQAVALVVAETFEQARDAAALLRISYARVDGRFELAAQRGSAPLAPAYILGPPESRINDFDGAFAAAPVQLDETYTTPDHSHAMMEPQATIAAWEGDDVTCWLRSPRTAPCSPPSCSQRRLPRGQRAATDHTRRLVPISALPGRTRSWHGRACRPR